MQKDIGKLYVVATPIGNLEDLSLRAQKVFSQVTWIAAEDTRHSLGLLQHLGISKPMISYHEHNERERCELLIDKLKQGENGALISDAGTPLISDPGFLLVEKAHEAGIPVIPIPGACAAITALSASGIPTHSFLFEGFLPAKSSARCKRLEGLAKQPHTLIFYEAPHRITALVDDCVTVLSPQRKACIARELTKRFEMIHSCTLGDIQTQFNDGRIPEKGEFVLIVAGCTVSAENVDESELEIERVLNILLPEMSLKQAVKLATQLTGSGKNAVYDLAVKLGKDKP